MIEKDGNVPDQAFTENKFFFFVGEMTAGRPILQSWMKLQDQPSAWKDIRIYLRISKQSVRR